MIKRPLLLRMTLNSLLNISSSISLNYTTRRFSFIAILFLLISLALSPLALEAKPPHPVIFLHGFNSSAETWSDFAQILNTAGWEFGGVPTYNPITDEVEDVSPGDFYRLDFSDSDDAQYPAQRLTLTRRAYEVAVAIKKILAVNSEEEQVVLVGHSMGGLAGRAYLQGFASLGSDSPSRTYDDDVAAIITVGTPHLGAELAVVCEELPCSVAGIDPDSTSLAELRPDSPIMLELGDLIRHSLPSDISYFSIIGTGRVVWGTGQDGDGIVTVSSQNIASVAGTAALVHESTEIWILERPECDLLFPQSHTCETTDDGVQAKILHILNLLPPPPPPPPSTPPTVTTTGVSNILASTATFNLSVNPNGSSTVAWFRYGTSSGSLEEMTIPFNAGSGSSVITHSRDLSGLQCDRTYYFQAWADGYGEPVSGATLSFRTNDCSGGGGGGGSGSEELMKNGDFSDGDAFWIVSPDFYANDEFGNHHDGPGYAYLSEEDGDPGDGLNGTIYQQVTIPSNATSATLSYWVSITTSEPSGVPARDFLNATLQDEDGDFSAFLEILSNQNHSTGYFKRQFNLENFIGQTVRLHFLGTTNGSDPTVFRIDDISLMATLPDGSKPSVTTLHEDQVESHSARLNMRVNPNGLPTEAWFRWDDDTNLSFETDRISVGSGTSEVTARIDLDDLDCDETYYFEAFAENSAGEDDGVRNSFRTDECAVFDLVAFAPSVDDFTPHPGSSIRFSFSTTNSGNDTAPANVPVTYYFNGIAVEEDIEETSLAPGQVDGEAETYSVPDEEGTYEAWACLASFPEEPSASNNCTAHIQVTVADDPSEGPDLVVVQTTATSGTEVMVSDAFDMSALVRNIGSQGSELTIVRFVADMMGVLDEDDLMLGSAAVNMLSSDQERWQSDTVIAPSEPGVYLVGACVKGRNSEANVSNNCSPDPFWLTVTAPPNQAPSISVLEPDGSNDIADQDYTVYWSSSDPDDDAMIRLFYSLDSSCSSPAPISPVLVENDGQDSYSWYIKGLPDGEYFILATIHDGESEVSACSSGPVTIQGNPTPFLFDSFETGDLSRWSAVRPESGVGLSVTPDAAFIGDYGLRLELGSCPYEEELILPDQSIFGTEAFVGCDTIRAYDVDLEPGAWVTFTSGGKVELGNGFSVAAGARLVVGIDPALGLNRYLQDNSPEIASSYSAEFSFDASELTFEPDASFDILIGYNPAGTPVFRVSLSYDETQSVVVATSYSLRSDYVTWVPRIRPLDPEDKYIEVQWFAESTSEVGRTLLCSRDGVGNRGCSYQYHYLADVIGFVRLGVMDREGAVSGTLLLDQFASSEGTP